MGRVASKAELLQQATGEYARLRDQIATMSTDEIVSTPVCAAWTTKDLLAHLYGWQQLYAQWQRLAEAGEPVHLPAPGFTWRETPRLNDELYRRYRDLPLAEAESLLEDSHRRLLAEIEALDEEAVMLPGTFAWTGRNALETYLVSITAAHYRWARKEIRKGLRARPAASRAGTA